MTRGNIPKYHMVPLRTRESTNAIAKRDYGVPLSDVKRLVSKWKDGYDWRAHERELNKLPMLTRDIEVEGFGVLNIHYVHQRSDVESAIPLLFVHVCTWMVVLHPSLGVRD